MFKTRLISGIFLVIIALVLIITGGEVLLASLGVISLIGLFELYRVYKIEKTVLGFVGYGATVLFYANLYFHFLPENYFFAMVSLIACLAVYVLSFPKYHAESVMAAYFGIFYVSVMMSYVYQTRSLQMGHFLVWLIFLSSWGCDTCAYCAGRLFGKHKMAPVLSPHKTIEGAVGGVIGSVLLTVLYCFICGKFFVVSQNTMVVSIILTACCALVSMIGDLAASAIKRNKEIKDYGTLIPGHGGILDRFDSVIFTAPICYFIAVLGGM